jgi:hypothetical protein
MKIKLDTDIENDDWWEVTTLSLKNYDEVGRRYPTDKVVNAKRVKDVMFNNTRLGWMSMKKVHPKHLQDVLVLAKNGSIGIARWSMKLRTWLGRNNSGDDVVTHWHAIPEPPKTSKD